MLHDREVIDERYERLLVRRRRIERFAIRGIALALVAIAIASSVAGLMPGTETFDGTRLVESTRAGGGFGYVAVAAISCVMMALVWCWPRPRNLFLTGMLLWVVGAIAFVVTFTSGRHRWEPNNYSYVVHHSAEHVADVLMSLAVIAWFAVPLVALVYGIGCVAVDDHVRRKLPPAPEFPVARIR